jgi:hypothetical protein
MDSIRRTFSYNSIIVIESLLATDEPTGSDLYKNSLSATPNGLFFEPDSAAKFLSVLAEIETLCVRDGARPILHLEMHGLPEGLVAANKEVILWRELAPVLQRINAATEVNLLVTIASCHGAEFVRTIDPDGRAPFWGMFGPIHMELPSEIRRGYTAFYESLQTDPDLWHAIEALRQAVTWPEHWVIYLAEMILALGFGQFHSRYSTEEALLQTETDIVESITLRNSRPPTETERQSIHAQLRDNGQVFERFKQRFLCLDEFPNNAERFPLTMREALEFSEMDSNALARRVDEW